MFASNNFIVLSSKKEDVEIDTELIQNKSKHWMKIIDDVIDNSDEKSLESGVDSINKVKDKFGIGLVMEPVLIN